LSSIILAFCSEKAYDREVLRELIAGWVWGMFGIGSRFRIGGAGSDVLGMEPIEVVGAGGLQGRAGIGGGIEEELSYGIDGHADSKAEAAVGVDVG
jgi:hypothetical protein